jgi:hypothetical protein
MATEPGGEGVSIMKEELKANSLLPAVADLVSR